jgi:tripartite-type tricarboxylate transporter receptor subunit TctC
MSGKEMSIVSNGYKIIVFLLIFVFCSVATAETNPDLKFYEGKVVSIIVPTKAGGGFDSYARMTARFLRKHLPKSTVIVRNVPGAGHIIGANELYFSEPDGLTIGVGNFKGLLFGQLAGMEGIKFDLAKFSWLGNAASEPMILIVGKNTPFKSVKDLKDATHPARMGASGVGSASYNYPLMVGKVIGIHFKMIPGFQGSEVDMAMLRNDVDGQMGYTDSLRPLIEGEGARVLLAVARKRPPQYPKVPMIFDFTTPQTQGLVNFLIATVELGRPFAAPPNMPAGRLKVLRDAMEKTFNDPELLAYAKKAMLPVSFTSGDETKAMFVNGLKQSPDVIKLIKELSGPE